MVGLVLVGGGTLLWMLVPVVFGDGTERDLEDACDRVGVGDPVEVAFAELGPEGYRKGCGTVAPCSTLDLGPELGSVLWLCDPDDCSQLWRVGRVSCFIDVDPKTRRVTDVVLSEAPD